jgi:hypothetical protein
MALRGSLEGPQAPLNRALDLAPPLQHSWSSCSPLKFASTVTPWVIEVDKLGQAQAASPATADCRPTDPQIGGSIPLTLSIFSTC